MYQEGSKDRLFCFINLGKHNEDIKIPKFKNADLDKYLPKTMVNLMKQEQIGSSLAYKQAGHPSYELEIPVLNEENVGALLFYFELTTALMAEFMGVNAYDQQGVEMQKNIQIMQICLLLMQCILSAFCTVFNSCFNSCFK